MYLRIGGIAAAALAAIAIAIQPAAAGESGTFRMLLSGAHDLTTIELAAGAKYTAGDFTGTVSVIQSSGGIFLKGADYSAKCVVYATVSEEATDLRGACTMTGLSGDSWYTLATRRVGELEKVGTAAGRWQLVGGTGKYAGVSGGCPYQTKFLPGDLAVSTADCSWER